MIRLAELNEVRDMEEFFSKYAKIIKFGMYTLVVLMLLSIVFLFVQTSPIWGNILSDIWSSLFPFLIAFLLAYVIHPLILCIDRLRLPRVLSVFLFYLFIFGSLYGVISWFLPTILRELHDLVMNLPTYLEAIQTQIMIFDQKFNLNVSQYFLVDYSSWMSTLTTHMREITGWTFNMIFSIIGSLVNIIIVPIALFYFLKDFEKMMHGLLKIVPRRFRHHAVSIAGLLDESLGSYIRGVFLIMVTLSIIATILLMIAGIDYALLFGVLIGLTDFIPFIGPFIGAIPVVVFALSISWNKVIIVIIILAILQCIEANFLQPFIIGRNLDMHPLLIMMIMVVAATIMGFQGVFFALPVFLMIRTFSRYLYSIKEKHLD